MNTTPARSQGHRWIGLVLLTSWTLVPALCGQERGPTPIPSDPDLVLPRGWLVNATQSHDSAPWSRPPRPRLFRIPFGYLYETPANELADPSMPGAEPTAEDEESRLQFCMGSDNPYIDFRRPGDPGGVGYFKVQTLVPLLGTQSVELSLGLQAVTPAGLEADGLANGPTILSPTLVWFQDLGGPALQGFIGQHLPALGRNGDSLQRGWLYGFALQQPLLPSTDTAGANLHLFVEALGKQRRELLPGQRTPSNWELLPGLHWRVSDSCWMSGGVILPLGSTRPDPGLWQFTCRWQY